MTEKGTAPLRGLVLAGGESRRMRRDKGAIDYHGVPQAQWSHDLLAPFCAGVLVSVREAQRSQAPYRDLPLIVDREAGQGPAAGLLAAWALHPEAAWLVLAADMPHVSPEVLRALVAGRDPGRLATTFRHGDGTLEPLCAVWEPTAARPLAMAVADGRSSLRRLLETSDVRVLKAPHGPALVSVNSPEDCRQAGGTEASGTSDHG
jgi:molybdenum cofactor guanylyltransferase